MHTYIHPFNGPLSGTTRVSQYQKGKEAVSGSGISWVVCKSAPRSWQIISAPLAAAVCLSYSALYICLQLSIYLQFRLLYCATALCWLRLTTSNKRTYDMMNHMPAPHHWVFTVFYRLRNQQHQSTELHNSYYDRNAIVCDWLPFERQFPPVTDPWRAVCHFPATYKPYWYKTSGSCRRWIRATCCLIYVVVVVVGKRQTPDAISWPSSSVERRPSQVLSTQFDRRRSLVYRAKRPPFSS